MRSSKRQRCTRRTTPYGARRHLSRGCGRDVPLDPGPPWVQAAAVGYVAAGVPLLGAPSLADSSADVIDDSTLSFLLQRALQVKRKEEEEAVEAAELVEMEEKLAAAEGRLLEVLRQEREGTRVTRQTWSTLSRVEQFAVHWFMAKDAVGKRRVKRKKKKRRRRTLSKAPLPRCGRPCALQRHVPAFLRVLASGSASTEWWTFLLCSRDRYPQCSSRSWCSSWARSLCPCCATTGIWSDSAECRAGAAVAVHPRSSTSLSCRRVRSPWSSLVGRS